MSANVGRIDAVRPGVRYLDVHRAAGREVVRGLLELGILRGQSVNLTGGDQPERVFTGFIWGDPMASIGVRPLLGRGVFLAEGDEWQRQRRLLAPTFTPQNVERLLPHFHAAAADLVRRAARGRALPERPAERRGRPSSHKCLDQRHSGQWLRCEVPQACADTTCRQWMRKRESQVGSPSLPLVPLRAHALGSFDELLREVTLDSLRGQPPRTRNRSRPESLPTLNMTLRQYYAEKRERYTVSIRYPRDLRSDPQSIGSQVLVPTANGGMVPLGQVASVKLSQGPVSIRTENAQLAVYVFIDVQGRDIGSYVADAQKALVYCPTGESAGCETIVSALASTAAFSGSGAVVEEILVVGEAPR